MENEISLLAENGNFHTFWSEAVRWVNSEQVRKHGNKINTHTVTNIDTNNPNNIHTPVLKPTPT